MLTAAAKGRNEEVGTFERKGRASPCKEKTSGEENVSGEDDKPHPLYGFSCITRHVRVLGLADAMTKECARHVMRHILMNVKRVGWTHGGMT